MSAIRSKDRISRCSFTFADGRRCRTPRQSGHPSLCCFHARKEAQAQAAEEIGRDVRYFLSGDFLSACDLSLALGRVFAGAARGHLKPKTARTLAYLGQTLLQTIQLAQNEYINAFSTDRWRRVIHSHIKENTNYLFSAPPPAPAPAAADPVPDAGPVPDQTPQQLPAEPGPDQPRASVEAGLQPGAPHCVSPSVGPNSSQAGREPVVSNACSSPAPKRLSRRAAEFAAAILASASSSPRPVAEAAPPCSAGFTPASSPDAAASPSGTRQPGVVTSDPPSSPSPKRATAPPTNNSSPASPQSSPQPTQASELPGFGAPANWEVLIPQARGPVRRRRQIRPWHLPE